jgi:hypothetical protein
MPNHEVLHRNILVAKWPWDDILHPALFPYALASVCVLWRDILLTSPEFWTRVVVFLGCKFNPSWFSDFRSELAASRDTLIEIFILRDHSEASANLDFFEERHVRAVMDALFPHVVRCTQLTFHLLHTSSLPPICDDIGLSPDLISLKLYGKHHHERSISSPAIPDHLTGGDFIFPNLRYLAIDGRNFIDACKRFPDWIDELSTEDSDFVLCIVHLTCSEGENFQFPLYEALGCMTNLCHLVLRETEFSIEPGSHDYQSIDLNLIGLTLESLSYDFIHEFLFVGLFHVTEDHFTLEINRCPLAAFDISDFEVQGEVTLKHITDSDELVRFFLQRACYGIHLEDCSGFDDHFLREISVNLDKVPSKAIGVEQELDCPDNL